MTYDTTIERAIVLMECKNIYDLEAQRYPLAVKIAGQIHDWPVEGIEWDSGHLLVHGRRFLFERYTESRSTADGLGEQIGYTYRYPRGWRVLTEYATPKGLKSVARGEWPLEDRQAAWLLASRDITNTLARFDEQCKAVLVWQDGTEFSEPVAELDGRNHTRPEAAQAMLDEEWLPWDWEVEDNEGAEDARPDSSAPEAPPHEEPSNGHSSTNGGISQLLHLSDITAIRPVWGDPFSTDLDLRHGASKVRIEVPHSQVETQARLMGWSEPVSGSGYWMRPS